VALSIHSAHTHDYYYRLLLETLSVIGVGVRLAVCLKGAKIEKSLFCGLRNQYAPKT